MNGVTVIEEIVCHEVSLAETIFSCIFVCVIGALVLTLYASMYKRTPVLRKLIVVCSIIIASIIVGVICLQCNKYKETHIEYVIEVTEEASFLELMDKYEIISIDGNRLRVKEIQN